MAISRIGSLVLCGLLATGFAGLPRAAGAQPAPLRLSLDRLPQIFGLAVHTGEPHALQLATPLGLFRTTPRAEAVAVAGIAGDVMALAVHPADPRHLLAGGHVGQAGSLGLLESTDGGRHWKQLAPEAAGHVGFHILAFSPADPRIVYGITNGVRVSSDGGRTWREAGRLPPDLIHFAAGAQSAATVYAATQRGLFVSHDQGAHWARVPTPPGIVSMVHVTPDGQVFAFVVGNGLLVAKEPALAWTTHSARFEDQVLLRMVIDPAVPTRFYGATLTGAVITSADGGRNWGTYEGLHQADPQTIAKGRRLFVTHCQACHGPDGRGQDAIAGFDPAQAPPILAPALDDSAHAWHHSDADLVQTILEGSPRPGSPMVSWKGLLSRADAESLVAYVKSLWSLRSIACQGARHMGCMRH